MSTKMNVSLIFNLDLKDALQKSYSKQWWEQVFHQNEENKVFYSLILLNKILSVPFYRFKQIFFSYVVLHNLFSMDMVKYYCSLSLSVIKLMIGLIG